jgi:4-hydroxy-tetrahydrodipicolinate reductase
MKIALIGYGKMGKEVERTALERSHTISLIVDINNQQDLNPENLGNVDVAIDFTTPATVTNNILRCFDAGVPVVTGTTGWNKDIKRISEICVQKEQSLFHASNFGIGVNIFFAVNEYLASLMKKFQQYDVSIDETHHTQKLDAPSGTAITLAEQVIERIGRKTRWQLNEAVGQDSLIIKSIREGDIKGIHEVRYDSEVDYLMIKHYAKSRTGFAIGAVLAAEFILGKKGVYTMRDLMGL